MVAAQARKAFEGITLDDLLFLVLEEKRMIDSILVGLAKIRAKEKGSDQMLPTEAVFDILEALDEAHMETRDALTWIGLSQPDLAADSQTYTESSSSSSSSSTRTPSIDEPLECLPGTLQPPMAPSIISSTGRSQSRSVIADEEGGDTVETPLTSPCSHHKPELAPSTSTPTPTPTDRSRIRSVRSGRSSVGPPPSPPPKRPLPPVPTVNVEDEVPSSPTTPSENRGSGASWPFLRHRSSHFSDPSSEDIPIRGPSPKGVRFASIRSSRVTIEDAHHGGLSSFLDDSDDEEDADDDDETEDGPPWGKTKADELVRKVKDCLKACRSKMRSWRVVEPRTIEVRDEGARAIEDEYASNAPLSLLPVPAAPHAFLPQRH